MHDDLRGWIEEVDKKGKLIRISGAHWEKEMAALAELFCHKKVRNAGDELCLLISFLVT
jgi:hypothetical protein